MSNKKDIYTLGPKGSFHHLSCKEYLGGEKEIKFCENFNDIFDQVKAGNLGWIALFNSLAGPVENHENSINKSFTLLDELDYDIQLCIATSGNSNLSDIKKLLSHEKAFGETKSFLKQQLPQAEHILKPSTSDAAKIVAELNSEDTAAICHAETAKYYGLNMLTSIKFPRKNITTFALFC